MPIIVAEMQTINNKEVIASELAYIINTETIMIRLH